MNHSQRLAYSAILSICLLSHGCQASGDGVFNDTEKPIVIVIYTKNGKRIDQKLSPGMSRVEGRIPSQEGVRYRKIEAYDLAGRKLCEFDLKDLPNRRGRYGTTFTRFRVTESGIYPVPQKGAPPDVYVDNKKLIQFFEQERAYEDALPASSDE